MAVFSSQATQQVSPIGVFRSSVGGWYFDSGNGKWDGCNPWMPVILLECPEIYRHSVTMMGMGKRISQCIEMGTGI
jgi:hypothetical protein